MDDYFYETSNLDSLHFLKTMMEMRLSRCAAVCLQNLLKLHVYMGKIATRWLAWAAGAAFGTDGWGAQCPHTVT